MGQDTQKNRAVNEKIVSSMPHLLKDLLADNAVTDRWSPQHVRKGHWKERPRELLQLGARHHPPASLSTLTTRHILHPPATKAPMPSTLHPPSQHTRTDSPSATSISIRTRRRSTQPTRLLPTTRIRLRMSTMERMMRRSTGSCTRWLRACRRRGPMLRD